MRAGTTLRPSSIICAAGRNSSCSNPARPSSRTWPRCAARRSAPAAAPCFRSEIAAWSEANCGSNPIQFVGTEGSADARTQLKQGRIDAAVQGNETLPYLMDLEPGVYAPVGEPFATQFTGIALPVKEKALQQAMLEALDALIADGTYTALLAKWKLTDDGSRKGDDQCWTVRHSQSIPLVPANTAAPAPEYPWPKPYTSAMFLSFDVDAESAWTSKDAGACRSGSSP